MPSILRTLRTPKVRVVLLGAAVAIAAVAAWGGPGATTTRDPSDAAAIEYVRSHRVDLGAPGLAVGIVHGQEATVAATGDAAPGSPFVIGSATKSFTALAVLQLAEAGRVRLDEPAVRYVPDFATNDRKISGRITLR